MGSYRLYFLDAAILAGAEIIDADDDEEAVSIARDRANGHSVEIWDQAHRIRTIESTERFSGRRF